MKMAKKKIEDVDLYALLDLQITASESEVRSSNRLLCNNLIIL